MTNPLYRIALFCLGALMAFPVASNARPGPRGGGGEGMDLGRLERMADKLDLDEDTLAAMKKRLYEGQEVGIELHAALQAAQLKVRRSMDEDLPNRSEVMKNLESLSAAQLKLRKHRTNVLLDIQGKLTPEQRKKIRRHLRKRGHGNREGQKGRRHRKRNADAD